MGLLNLTKDGKYIFNRVVNSVKFYDKDQAAQLLGEIGHMGKSAVSITCIPRSTELIGGNKYQLGYDITIEITSEQLYGMFEFDKLKNKNVWIEFPELPLFFNAETTLNVEVMMNLGETTGRVKISAGAYATDLKNAFFSHWYNLIQAPWATPDSVPVDNPQLPTGEYHYQLRDDDPYIELITPPTPDSDDSLTVLKLLLYDEKLNPLTEEPTVTDVEYFDGFVWTALVVSTDYTVIYEGGYYKISINTMKTVLHLKTEVRVKYTLA